jgi:dolichol kinase
MLPDQVESPTTTTTAAIPTTSITPPEKDLELEHGELQEEATDLREFTRSPHPYHRHGSQISQQSRLGRGSQRDPSGGTLVHEQGRYTGSEDNAASSESEASVKDGIRRVAPSTTGSESGTEADDERPDFMKLLPPPSLRPRKGLKIGERSEEAFLSPSQLDDEGRDEEDYFRRRKSMTGESEEARKRREEEEQEKLYRRRLHEFARRSSEVVLVGVIVLIVLYGEGVWDTAWEWRMELVSHLLITALLILVYPIKLSIVDTRAIYSKPWQRFRVPASFDPATVLYPPFLPVLVALTVSPLNPQIILPNIILGLASLPQRLFPRSSRFAGINVVHWFISILPLLVSEHTNWISGIAVEKPYPVKAIGALPIEVLVTLYPLHQALLQPLQYLTTTSLLISELHLLSVVLINLLLFAHTPQTIIMKACLWIGGLSLFALTERVLHWNVTLARVPKWKLRRPGHTAEERKSLVDAVSDLIQVQRATSAFRSSPPDHDSDADEDQPEVTLKKRPNGRPKLTTRVWESLYTDADHDHEPQSAVEPRKMPSLLPKIDGSATRPRRSTLPESLATALKDKVTGRRPKGKSANLLWCLQLTPTQAARRKWLYAAFIYAAIVFVVLGPVRVYVSHKALDGQEPIGWAISYLLGHLNPARTVVTTLGLQNWIPLPPLSSSHPESYLTLPLNIPHLRSTLGPSNLRLILIAYWLLVLLIGLLAVFNLTAYVEVDTRRKVFHGVMVAMLLPSTFVDPCACALALALILAVFLLLEAVRAGQVPPLGNALARFVAPYVDGRDLRGPVVVSHIFLLVGCAVPLWFSLAASHRDASGWELAHSQRDVGMLSGVICVGMGDAAASLIGRRYGRHKWSWVGGKSFEGSAAFAVAVTIGLIFAKVYLALGGWEDAGPGGSCIAPTALASAIEILMSGCWVLTLFKAFVCACGASFMEAVLTGANDNVVVPVVLWLLVKGVRL